MKDNFLLNQLAQAVVDGSSNEGEWSYCVYCEAAVYRQSTSLYSYHHKPHCIVLVAEQILKGSEDA